MFRRRKGREGDDPVGEMSARMDTELSDEGGEDLDGEPDDVEPLGDAGEDGRQAAGQTARTTGPWDVEDLPDDDVVRFDLGAIRVPGVDGADVQVNLEEATGQVMAVTVVLGESALQLQAFAAPRGEATWPQVRTEIATQITRDGGLADVEDSGDLRAQLPLPQPDGTTAPGAVRFIGVDGPRWLLRGVLSGRAAADADVAAPLLEAFRGVVVVRGHEAFAPGDPLTLRLPGQLLEAEPGDDSDPLGLEGPGPTITEIR